MSRISTHVLDTALGRPAAGIMVHLEQAEPSGEWKALAAHETDGDGRCANLLPQDGATGFAAGAIPAAIRDRHLSYGAIGQGACTRYVEIMVTVRPGDTHLHVPLLLSPNGYTTYRGS